MYTGSCLCGGVQFRVTAALAPIQICHCQQCRKAQGGPFATNIPVSASDFQLDSGGQLLSSFESSPGKKRVFCSVCGSPVYSYRLAVPGVLRLRAGLLNEALATSLAAHGYVQDRCNWWPIVDDLPQFDGPIG